MDAPFMEEFHRKRQQRGIIYASNDWLTLMLDQELCSRTKGGMLSSVSENDILSGPFMFPPMNQTTYIIKALLRQVELAVTISLGLERGPVICWACRPLDRVAGAMHHHVGAWERKGGKYE